MQTELVPQILREGDQATLKPVGNITALNAPDLRSAMKTLLADGVSTLVIDLSDVQIVDSTGIGLFVAAHNSLMRINGAFEVHNASPDLLDLFKSLRLDRHFRITGAFA
jgi:anti-sigma B factor antagonist